MEPAVDTTELAEPHLARWLKSLRLDVEYTRAEGNTLHYLTDEGEEISVLDLVGGWGATMLGHNHPDLVAYAKELLDAGTPIHAQYSKHPYANVLAEKINGIIHREFGVDEPYWATFANSGAESVEAAVKHAELDRRMRLAALRAGIEDGIGTAVRAAASGARVDPSGLHQVAGVSAAGGEWRQEDDADLTRLVAGLRRTNEAAAQRPPVLLALRGAFHGKLMGSVQLTQNPVFRTPFSALGLRCRFVSLEPQELAAGIEAERGSLLGLVADGTRIQIVRHELPVFCAFLVEPVQGEAGIRVLDRENADLIRELCDTVDCPVVVDEVQSGMGRTGAFFAASHIGLLGDYIVLAKSLGGGLAKTGMMLVSRRRYRPEFELTHSSTFAKDSYSTLIATKVVDLLEAEGGAAYRTAARRGKQLIELVTALAEEFPDVVEEVRGKGLMVALEIRDQTHAASEVIREQARAGALGYLLAGYLLRAHSVRTFPTASATHTMRLEPSVLVTDADIAQAGTALRGMLAAIQAQDGDALTGC